MVAVRFKKQTIKIKVYDTDRNGSETDGSETVKALVRGEWAIHQGYKVTHVPTGLSLGIYFNRLRHAKRFVLGLESIGLANLGDTFGEDGSRLWDWDTRLDYRAKIHALYSESKANP